MWAKWPKPFRSFSEGWLRRLKAVRTFFIDQIIPRAPNFFNNERIGLIKTGALFVNPSPMELLDFDALVSRLKNNEISFILDHSDEMTTDQLALLKPYKQCVIYPPVAYTTEEATMLKKGNFVGNIENFIKNEPTNKVNN